MPDAPLTPDRRTLGVRDDMDALSPPARAPFVELGLMSCFSFLRGASDAVDLVLTARALGYDAIGIADMNSMAGIVRIHSEARTAQLTPVIGCRVETVEGATFLVYPRNRAAYGRLCAMLSAAKMTTLDGTWQAKGETHVTLTMLAGASEDSQLILVPPDDIDAPWLTMPHPAPGKSRLVDTLAHMGGGYGGTQKLCRCSA